MLVALSKIDRNGNRVNVQPRLSTFTKWRNRLVMRRDNIIHSFVINKKLRNLMKIEIERDMSYVTFK